MRTEQPGRLTVFLFAVYLLILVGVVIFKLPFHAGMGAEVRVLNLIPLAGSFNGDGSFLWRDVINNVLAFVPMGLYVSALERDWSLPKKVLACAVAPIAFETIQFVCVIGRADITDVLANTLGGIVGIACYALLARIFREKAARALNIFALPLTLCVLLGFGYLYFGFGVSVPDVAPSMPRDVALEAADSEMEEAPSTASPPSGAGAPLLVNTAHPLPEDYQPAALVALNKGSWLSEGDILVAAEIEQSLMAMLADAGSSEAVGISITSAYRSRSEQAQLYEQAEDKSYVQPPGASEHETGLAVDLGIPDYAVQQWLENNSWKYGFIMRYPPNKEFETGISYEPWHFRFVGYEVAKICYEQGLCLEEYVELYVD